MGKLRQFLEKCGFKGLATPENAKDFREELRHLYGVCLSLGIVCGAAVWMSASSPSLVRWLPFVGVGLVFLAGGGLLLGDFLWPRILEFAKRRAVRWLLVLAVFLVLIWNFLEASGRITALRATDASLSTWKVWVYVLLWSVATSVLVKTEWSHRKGFGKARWAIGTLVALGTAFIWATFLFFPGTSVLVSDLLATPVGQVLKTILVGVGLWVLLGSVSRAFVWSSERLEKICCRVIDVGALWGVAQLSFRSDQLFFDGAIFHWEYFTAVVRHLRNGDFLLWNVPSQYGFLNLTIASWIPAPNSWHAFYLFQSLLLCAVGFAAYGVVVKSARNAIAGRLLACVFCAVFFFADHHLIGPQPYPSSSVVRFGPSYFLIFYFAMWARAPELMKSRLWLWVGGLLWSIGQLWSAESSVYCFVIYFSGVIASAIWGLHTQGRKATLRVLVHALGSALSWIVLFVVALGIAYYFRFGSLPDWSAFYVYGFSYAAGFGALPIFLAGPMWVLMIPVILMMAAVFLDIRHRMWNGDLFFTMVCWAALWSLSSYYVGRAVAENIVAMFPQVSLILILVATQGNLQTKPVLGTISKTFTTSFLMFCLLTGVFQKGFSEKMKGYRGWVSDIAMGLTPADSEVEGLYKRNGVTPETPVVYHGWNSFVPPLRVEGRVIPFESTWMPSPLALLEEPIAPARQERTLERYMGQRRIPGYLIQQRGQFEDRLERWLQLLKKTHSWKRVERTPHWDLYRFEPRPKGRE